MKKLILHDYFSGTGGFHLGLEKAGFEFKEVCFSEIDKHAIANYKYNFPNAKYIGGIGSVLSSGVGRPNIITFGSPCQDFSLAGLRKGLEGKKSSLIEQAISAIAYYRPDFFIWENVKGTFSSNSGSDFWAIIQAFANIGGYGLEWQLVNTSWLLPQNRERIYLVGHLTASFRNWKRIFPIREEGSYNNEIRSEARSDIARTIIAGYGKIPTDGQYVKVTHKCIDLKSVKSTTRRGMVKNNQTHTLDTDCYIGVVQLNPSTESSGVQPFQHNRIYDQKGLAPALNTDARSPIIKDSNTRRLTEKECERLQGFPDDWTLEGLYISKKVDRYIYGKNKAWRTEKATASLFAYAINHTKLKHKKVSQTQRYKMCGNAVTTLFPMTIGKLIKANYDKRG